MSFLWIFGFSIMLMVSTTNAGAKNFCGTNFDEEDIANERRMNQTIGKRNSHDSIKNRGSTTATHDELQEVNIEETLNRELIDENPKQQKDESYIESSILFNTDIVITNDDEQGSINIPISNEVQPSRLEKSIDENQNNKKDENYIESSISLHTEIVITNDIISNEVQPSELETNVDELITKDALEAVGNDLKKTKECLIKSQQKVEELQTQLNKIRNENTSSEDGKKLKTKQDAPDDPNSIKTDTNAQTEEDRAETPEETSHGYYGTWKKITLGACILSIALNFILCYSFASRKKITTVVTQNDDEEPQVTSLDSVTRSALYDQNIQHQHFIRSESYSPDAPNFYVQELELSPSTTNSKTSSEHSGLKLDVLSPVLENEHSPLKLDVISLGFEDIEHSPLELDVFSPMLENNEE